MATKRTGIGGAGARTVSVAEEAPKAEAAPQAEQPQEAVSSFDHLWGTPSTSETDTKFSDILEKSQIGDTPEEDTAKGVFKEPKFQEQANTTEALQNFAMGGKKPAESLKGSAAIEAGGIRSLKADALGHHVAMFGILDNLSSKIEEMRKTHPLVDINDPTKRSQAYDAAQRTLEEAANHLSQAGIEHQRNHFGVSYLDRSENIGNTRFARATSGGAKAPQLTEETSNKPVGALGYGSTRGQKSAAQELRASVGQESEPLRNALENLPANGAIGLTEAAKRKMIGVANVLQSISDNAESQGLNKPVFKADSIKDAIRAQAQEYALKIDAAHLRDNPDREEPLGSAVQAYRAERNATISNPDVLEGLGETALAENRRAGIKAMFDRREQGKRSLDAARSLHLGIQRTLTRNAFLRVFGKKLSENKQAVQAITAQRAPIFQSNYDAARIISEKSREQGGFGDPVRDENTHLITGVVHELPTYSLDARTGVGAESKNGSLNAKAKDLLDRAQQAISSAKASGDEATAATIQGHIDELNHHIKGAKLNANPNAGVFGRGDTPDKAIKLALSPSTQRTRYDPFSSDTPVAVYNEDESPIYGKGPERLDAYKWDRFANSLPSFVPFIKATPGQEFKELANNSSANSSSEVKHAFYEKPVIENGQVREGKNDDAIAALTRQYGYSEGQKVGEGWSKSKAQQAADSDELQRLYAENRATREGLLTKGGNPKGELKDADSAYLASQESTAQRDLSVAALKKYLSASHDSSATRKLSELRETLQSAGAISPDIANPGKIARIEQPELPEYNVPHPELFAADALKGPLPTGSRRLDRGSSLAEQAYDLGRRRIATRFADVAGLPTDIEGPNLQRMETASGKPMDYKQARNAVKKGGRRFAFGDALGQQYEYGSSFIPEQIKDEQDFYGREAARKAQIDTEAAAQAASLEKFGERSRSEALAANTRNDAARSRAKSRLGDLAPLAGRGGWDQRGWQVFTQPMPGRSGKEAVIPGVGIVPLNGQKVKDVEKSLEASEENAKKKAAEEGSPATRELTTPRLRGQEAPAGELDVMDLENNVRGGRQFRDYSQEALDAQQKYEQEKNAAGENLNPAELAAQEEVGNAFEKKAKKGK